MFCIEEFDILSNQLLNLKWYLLIRSFNGEIKLKFVKLLLSMKKKKLKLFYLKFN